jgi:aldehyde dehydrogenase (NAD+)
MSVLEIFKSMEYGPATEASDAAQAWLEAHDRRFDLFINNQWVRPSTKHYTDSVSPANEQVLAKSADAGAADLDQAVAVARDAFKTWSKLSGHARARHLYALARHLQKHHRLLAVIESMDNGKPIRESRDIDVPLVFRHFYHHAGWAQLAETELAGYEPVGVVGQIIPWNFPLLMLAWKIAPAIAMGNTVVIKPAPYTRLSALLFAEIVVEAGIPAGVINVLTGNDETGKLMVSHPGFDKIAFTGSTPVGKLIRQATAGTGKRLSLELGGKSPFIIFDDADQDAAIEGLVDAIWFNQGQVCCAGSRMLVQESIAEGFYKKLRRRMSQLRIGDPLDKAIDIGAIVAPVQLENIERWVKLGQSEGAEMYQPECEIPAHGWYYRPTLLTNVSPASTVAQEEIFGPVLVGMTFRTPSEAVDLANNTRFGLAASVWSENINLATEIARKVKAGVVWINCTNHFDAAAGFGGYRESGFGREGGKEGLYEYIQPTWQGRPQPYKPSEDNGSKSKKWGATVPGHPMLLNGQKVHTNGALPPLDRTAKLFIGGKQVRPDGGYSRPVMGADGVTIGEVGDGNRKDIRDAVEAAHAAKGWADRTPHVRAQIMYYIAENLAIREEEFTKRLSTLTGQSAKEARLEVEAAISRLFSYAAWADKYGGTIQETTLYGAVLAFNEPIGVIGIACPDEHPLLGFVSLLAPAIARGNTVVILPSEKYPLLATDFYQILETSDLPGGVVNIVTGSSDHLTKTLVEHEDVDAMWYFRHAEGCYFVEYLSAVNMKRTWVDYGGKRDWLDRHQGVGEEFLREATQVKNIWIPSGE